MSVEIVTVIDYAFDINAALRYTRSLSNFFKLIFDMPVYVKETGLRAKSF